MKGIALLLGLAVAAGAGWVEAARAAELYRWVEENGRVHYSDQPPPPEVRNLERRRLGDKPGASALPYGLQEAVRQFPVTVYTAEGCGEGCKQGVAYLTRRGVPFTEKDARVADNANVVMSHAGGKLEVPLLIVGGSALRGYEESTWAATLDAAGYPRSSALPPGLAARHAEPSQVAKDTQEQPAEQPGDANPDAPATN
jgi:glutaredoxin